MVARAAQDLDVATATAGADEGVVVDEAAGGEVEQDAGVRVLGGPGGERAVLHGHVGDEGGRVARCLPDLDTRGRTIRLEREAVEGAVVRPEDVVLRPQRDPAGSVVEGPRDGTQDARQPVGARREVHGTTGSDRRLGAGRDGAAVVRYPIGVRPVVHHVEHLRGDGRRGQGRGRHA